MSHRHYNTTYNEECSQGSIDKKTLYVDHNNSSDYVIIHNEKGEILLVIPDTIDNNILDAINRLYAPYKEDGSLKEGISITLPLELQSFKHI